jgi:hypothetical protein
MMEATPRKPTYRDIYLAMEGALAERDALIASHAAHERHPVGTTVELYGHTLEAIAEPPYFRCSCGDWSPTDHQSFAREQEIRDALSASHAALVAAVGAVIEQLREAWHISIDEGDDYLVLEDGVDRALVSLAAAARNLEGTK